MRGLMLLLFSMDVALAVDDVVRLLNSLNPLCLATLATHTVSCRRMRGQ
jgi:hypothetical protein